MSKPLLAFIGAGDLAARAMANRTLAEQFEFIGVARSARSAAGVTWLQGNAADEAVLAQLAEQTPAGIVVTLVPNGQGEAGYRQGYLAPLKALLQSLKVSGQTPFIVFASSTAVFPQTAGEWVHEQDAAPSGYAGAVMLEAEALLANSGLNTCALRFGGIYGPERDYLIRQVQAGNGGDESFTNRIHQDDAANAVAFASLQLYEKKILPDVLNVCDSDPAPSQDVRLFIAEQLNISRDTLKPSASGRGGNKRVSNQALLDLGFQLQYPSYKEGYLQKSVF